MAAGGLEQAVASNSGRSRARHRGRMVRLSYFTFRRTSTADGAVPAG